MVSIGTWWLSVFSMPASGLGADAVAYEGGDRVIAVCDGIGSSASARKAAEVSAHEALKVMAASEANGEQWDSVQNLFFEDGLCDQGAAFVGARIFEDLGSVRVFWLGDCRALLWSPSSSRPITLLTRDHTLAADFRSKGLTVSGGSTLENTLTRFFGDGHYSRPSYADVRVSRASSLVLMTDGFYRGIEVEAFFELLAPAASHAERYGALCSAVPEVLTDDCTFALLTVG